MRALNQGPLITFPGRTVFKLNDDDKLEFVATADDSRRSDIESAVDVCPMQAISIVE